MGSGLDFFVALSSTISKWGMIWSEINQKTTIYAYGEKLGLHFWDEAAVVVVENEQAKANVPGTERLEKSQARA